MNIEETNQALRIEREAEELEKGDGSTAVAMLRKYQAPAGKYFKLNKTRFWEEVKLKSNNVTVFL